MTGAAPARVGSRGRRAAAGLLLLALAAGCTSPSAPGGPSARAEAPTSGTGPGSGGGGPLNGTTPNGTAPSVPAPPGSVRLGAKWDWSRMSASEAYLARLRGGVTFYELAWCDLERSPGAVDWSAVDGVVDRSRALGITMMLKIRVGACWATSGTASHQRGKRAKTESLMPHDLAAYQGFVRAVVARYSARGVHEYALENEVNGESFWGGTPAELEQLARAGAQAVRAADPHASVVDFGISSTAYGAAIADRLLREHRDADALAAYDTYYARRFATRAKDLPRVGSADELRSALATGQPRRNLDYLALDEKLLRDGVFDVRQVHFYEAWDSVPALLDYLHATTPADVPLEAWEVGQFDSDAPADPGARSDEAVKTVALFLAGGVRVLVWLPLSSSATGPDAETRLGLQSSDGQLRPVADVFAELATALRSPDATATRPPSPLTGVSVSTKTSSLYVVWAASGPDAPLPAALAQRTTTPSGPAPTHIGATPVVLTGAGRTSAS